MLCVLFDHQLLCGERKSLVAFIRQGWTVLGGSCLTDVDQGQCEKVASLAAPPSVCSEVETSTLIQPSTMTEKQQPTKQPDVSLEEDDAFEDFPLEGAHACYRPGRDCISLHNV